MALCGPGCELPCGGHHRLRGKTTTGLALDGTIFTQIHAYLIHNMNTCQIWGLSIVALVFRSITFCQVYGYIVLHLLILLFLLADILLQHGLCYSVRDSLQWRCNGHDGISNHQPYDCLLNRLFGRGSKKTPKLRITGLCAGNSPVTGEFPAQMTSNAENVSI